MERRAAAGPTAVLPKGRRSPAVQELHYRVMMPPVCPRTLHAALLHPSTRAPRSPSLRPPATGACMLAGAPPSASTSAEQYVCPARKVCYAVVGFDIEVTGPHRGFYAVCQLGTHFHRLVLPPDNGVAEQEVLQPKQPLRVGDWYVKPENERAAYGLPPTEKCGPEPCSTAAATPPSKET